MSRPTTSHETAARTTAPRGMLLIISGPSGVGKTTITRQVERQLGGVFSVSMTTRPKTSDDIEGVDYHFVSEKQFLRARDEGELLEWAKVFDNYYGTPRKPVQEALADGRLMILEIDVDGAAQIKRNMPEAFAIFVLPPSEDVLLDRLRSRKREDEATIQRRFADAKHEMRLARELGIYDQFIVNDNLARAVQEAVDLVRARIPGPN
jgi:guanylate kinase